MKLKSRGSGPARRLTFLWKAAKKSEQKKAAFLFLEREYLFIDVASAPNTDFRYFVCRNRKGPNEQQVARMG